MSKLRGADILARAFSAASAERLFTLSGNQIMSVFDACIDTGTDLVHVRHEAAAVHMADAWGRLTGEPGVALVTAGPGLANSLSALYGALMAESPMVLLSGHAPRAQLGRGAFQEMAQAEMANHVTKASWTATEASRLGHDLARAFAVARSGRQGPVHIGLPVDLLNSTVEHPDNSLPQPSDFNGSTQPADEAMAERILKTLAEAKRPLILTGPASMRGVAPETMSSLTDETHVPVICMESPRGANDPSLGAFAEVLSEADLIVLLGKTLDFMLPLDGPQAVDPECRFIHVDPEMPALEQTRRVLANSPRLALASLAGAVPMAEQLVGLANQMAWPVSTWHDEVQSAISSRPPKWSAVEAPREGPLRAVEVCRAIQETLIGERDVFVSDGGEFGQWAQSCISAPHRIINGPAGSIGSSIPFAMAARLAFPGSRVVTTLGDGTFGFHAMEFDTAVRYKLPFVAVVGNDAAWNAEYQIQLREYGKNRLFGCELLPSRYDEVVRALGGHGEYVAMEPDLRPALERAVASGRPACVNVAIERRAAPLVRRG